MEIIYGETECDTCGEREPLYFINVPIDGVMFTFCSQECRYEGLNILIDFIAVVREVFTDIPQTQEGDDHCGYILWNHTGFPSFYMGDDPVSYFRNQIIEYKAKLDIGMTESEIWDDMYATLEAERRKDQEAR